MICPRCTKDTVLWVQRITPDRVDKAKKEAVEGTKVFLCEPCKGDWISLFGLFQAYWKKSRGRVIADDDSFQLYSMFLDNPFSNKVSKKKVAQAAVAVAGYRYGDFTKRQSVFIPEADLVTNEDYAWAAGVIDAVGKISDPENPGKICLIVKHRSKVILEKLQDLLGGNELKEEKGIWTYTTNKKSSEVLLKRMQPYLKCSKNEHPEEISDDDRTLAWIAGFAQASGKSGVITTTCKWAVRLMGTLFSGIETASGEEYSFAPEPNMRERLSLFLLKKLDPEGARGPNSGSDPRKVAAFQNAGGEDRALRVPKGSQPERPAGPKPNSVAGSTPAGEGSHSALVPKPKTRPPLSGGSVWGPEAGPPDLTPEIEVSGNTQVRLAGQAESCQVCRYMYDDLQKDKGFLRNGKQVELKGKLNHLYAEFEIEVKAECPGCRKEVPLRYWEDDWSGCGCFEGKVEVPGEPVDDKKWASV